VRFGHGLLDKLVGSLVLASVEQEHSQSHCDLYRRDDAGPGVRSSANDHLAQLNIPNIFQKLDAAGVSWKIYYTVTNGLCLNDDDCGTGTALYPATSFSYLTYSFQYLQGNSTGTCPAPTQPSSVVGDASNSFCIDPKHIAPISTYFTDLANGALPSFSFIEAGYGNNDEHPGSGNPF
jgi:phospholipase C